MTNLIIMKVKDIANITAIIRKEIFRGLISQDQLFVNLNITN